MSALLKSDFAKFGGFGLPGAIIANRGGDGDDDPESEAARFRRLLSPEERSRRLIQSIGQPGSIAGPVPLGGRGPIGRRLR